MDDRVDAFARLNRLRAQGILTDSEYDSEKAALMGGDSPQRLSLGERWAAGWEATSDMRRWLRWSFLGCVIVIGLIGTYFFGKAASIAEARGELPGPAETSVGEAPTGDLSEETSSLFGPDSPWTIQTTTDPMTDAAVSQATARFEGNQFDFEVVARCSSTGDIGYIATSFNKDGEPAEMRVTAIAPSVWGQVAGSQAYTAPRVTPGRLTIDFQMRADDNEPLSRSNSNPEFNNQIRLNSGAVQPLPADGSGGDSAEQMAAASKIVLRLFMPSGEETINWSQNDASFRRVLQPCLESRSVTRAELTAARIESDRKIAAEAEQRHQERVQENVRRGRPADGSVHAM